MSTTAFPNSFAQCASSADVSSEQTGRMAVAAKRVGGVLRELGLVLLKVAKATIMESRYRRAAREIRNLDDRLLRDIGITRSEIDSIVRYGRIRDAGRIF